MNRSVGNTSIIKLRSILPVTYLPLCLLIRTAQLVKPAIGSDTMRCNGSENCIELHPLCFCAPLETRVLDTGISSGAIHGYQRQLARRNGSATVSRVGFQRRALRVVPSMAAQDVPPSPEKVKTAGPNAFSMSITGELCLGAAGVLLCVLSRESILGPGFVLKPYLIGAAFLATAPLCMFSWGVGKLNPQVRDITVSYCRDLFLRRSTWEISAFCACVAIGEELFFRSWVLQKLMHIFGNIEGQVGSSVLFGLCHGQSATLIAASGLSGFYFSQLFIMSGNSVVVPLLVHFMYNFISILFFKRQLLREPSKSNQTTEDG